MISKKAKFISIFIVLASLISPSFLTAPVFAYDACDSSLPADVRKANGCDGSTDELPKAVTGIVNGIIGILASVAVIFIVVGGIQYMTSAGDAGKVKTAKNTILYALIGLVVCVLAFAIVNWLIAVLKKG